MNDEEKTITEEYIASCVKLIEECDDISLLDFIIQLLQKSKKIR